MRRPYRVNLLQTLRPLNGRLARAQTVLVAIKGTWLSAIYDADMLIAAFTVHLAFLIVFHPSIPFGHVRRRDLR